MSHAATTSRSYNFVLWGSDCEETMAVIFIAAFRAAGLRVKLVGISGGRIRGAYGLRLVPDLLLHDARPLARHASSVIIPCAGEGLQQFAKDPRLREFLKSAHENGAQLVMIEGAETPLLAELGLQTFPVGLQLLSRADHVAESIQCANQLIQSWSPSMRNG